MKRLIKAAFPVVALAVFLFLLFVALTRGQESGIIASGGSFVLEKASIAGGGSQKQLPPFDEHGTTGQAIAGHTSSGGTYSIYSGFWTPEAFAPTAAGVSVGGRITSAGGVGIPNVAVTITSRSNEIRSAISSSLGYYTFEDVPAGETYFISVSAKRFTFYEPVRALHVLDNLTDVDFVGSPID